QCRTRVRRRWAVRLLRRLRRSLHRSADHADVARPRVDHARRSAADVCLLVCLTACRPSRRRARTGWAGYRGLEPEWKQSRAMASYDYVCGQCGVFEVVRAIDAPVCEQVCPACGGATASPTPPEHPVDHHPVISPAPTPTRRAIRQQRLQPSPFLISQIMTIKHTDDLPEPRQKIHETRP